MKRILSTIIFLSIIGILHAQQPSVKVSLDSVYVTIGMPTTIHLEATVKDGQEIFFPNVLSHGGVVAYDDSLQFLLELGDEKPRIDTIPEGEGIMTLKEDIQVFAFDSATLMIPPFDFIYNGDTLSTNSLALRVIVPFDSIDVDPTKFVDIKTVIEPEFVFWDYIWWIISPIVLIILAVAVYYLYKYYIRRRGEEVIVKIEKKLPPHVIAFAALDELSEKKLWQSGQDKLFQTELTNILRQYIEDRFYISALEKTTDEILDDLYELSEHQKSSLKNLKQILQLADLTKFAKYKPLPDENQLSFMNAKMFVEQTKFEEKVMNENSEENNLEN